MPISRKSLSRVIRTAPAKAALAIGCAAAVASALALPARAATTDPTLGNRIIIRPSHPFPSFSFFPSTTPVTSNPGNPATVPVGSKKSAAPKHSTYTGYISTFSPAPPPKTSAPVSSPAACVAGGQALTGSGGDLDLPGITGTSKDPGHVGALPLSSLGPSSMLPPGIDSADLAQLELTRTSDAASANLSMVASSGYRFPCVHIEFGPGQGYSGVQYALVNAGLISDDHNGTTETLAWTYSSILWSYTLPGSTKVHEGSGRINARPDVVTGSLANDSRAIAVGTISLTLIVSLGLIGLYVVGKRCNRARYRARYYRRMVARQQRGEIQTAPQVALAVSAPVPPPAELELEPEPGPLPEPEREPEPEQEQEPQEAAESEESEESLEEESRESAEAEEPEEPEASEESSESDESSESEEPSELTESAQPEQPDEGPADSEEPAESAEPAESIEPVASEAPEEPEETAASSEPDESASDDPATDEPTPHEPAAAEAEQPDESEQPAATR